MTATPVDTSATPKHNEPMPGVLRQVWSILSPDERRRFLLLQPLVIVTGLLETAGLASVVPFLALLSDPQAVDRHKLLRFAYDAFGFASTTSFFFAVGVGVFVVITVGNGVNALTTWALLRFAWDGNHAISLRLLENYLARPYVFFLENNSSELAKNILIEVNQVVGGVLVVAMQMIARMAILVGIMSTLLVVDPMMAVATGGVFGVLYGGMFALVRKQLQRDGVLRHQANSHRHKVAAEALGSIKELKLYGLESEVSKLFEGPSRLFGLTQARAAVVGQLPRYALETIAFGGVLLIILGLLWRGDSLNQVLPVLGLYAFAAYRMLPGLQAIFTGFASIRFAQSAVDTLYRDLAVQTPTVRVVDTGRELVGHVELKDVRYSYPNAGRIALDGVSTSIASGEWVAFVGRTGAGKSTLIDVLLGLLTPDAGSVAIDGTDLSSGVLQRWQSRIAYVPQQIFLIDDTIENNICFSQSIDLKRLENAARIAQIHDFIVTELPDKYRTVIGERGIRLSGGQRQRIGIARALYRDPLLLVLDEATSALDNTTEEAFFTALRSGLAGVSVVSVAHRLSTTKYFDTVRTVDHGVIIDAAPQVLDV